MVKRKLWLAACGLALLGTLSGCANFTQTVRNSIPNPGQQREMRYDFAQLQERNGDLHKAEKAYRELADAKPKEAKFHHRLGIVLVRQGKLEDGVTELTKASELDQENALILNDLGYAQMLRGEYAAAETAIRKSLELDAKDTRARNNLALVLGYEGKMRESYEQFRLNNSEAEARANLAYVHTQRGELIAASKEYDQSLSKNPENKAAAEALVQLNSLQREMNADAAARTSEVQLASATTPSSATAPTSAPAPKPARKPVEQKKLAAVPEPAVQDRLLDRHESQVELLGEIETTDLPTTDLESDTEAATGKALMQLD